MLINVKSAGTLFRQQIIQQMNNIGKPAILLDEDLKIIDKNKSASAVVRLRRGAKLTPLLPKEHIKPIFEMKPHSVLSTTLNLGAFSCKANVICGADCRLAVFSQENGGLGIEVLEKYKKMSGYDITLVRGEEASEENILKEERRKGELSDIVENILDGLKGVRGLPFFNASAVLKSIENEIQNHNVKSRNLVRFSGRLNELITEGSDRDFILIITALIAFCSDKSRCEPVSVEVFDYEDELVFRVSGNSSLSDYDIACIATMNGKFASFGRNLGDDVFWGYLIKLFKKYGKMPTF